MRVCPPTLTRSLASQSLAPLLEHPHLRPAVLHAPTTTGAMRLLFPSRGSPSPPPPEACQRCFVDLLRRAARTGQGDATKEVSGLLAAFAEEYSAHVEASPMLAELCDEMRG